jgi:hypothetical protein
MAALQLSHSPEWILNTIRGEYTEMPGMRLTRAQFRRLWHLEDEECERAIVTLTGTHFLCQDSQGRLYRANA